MISAAEIVLRLVLGAAFGGVIGYERSMHGRAAGFRTQLLVCLASVLVMIVSEYYYYLGSFDPSVVRVDPGRIAAGAITGVGFLGAGVILKIGVSVQGLTTAACIWMVSAIGLAVGSGLYLAGSVSFGLTLFALLVLRTVERRMAVLEYKSLVVTAGEATEEEDISSVLESRGSTVHNVDYEKDVPAGEVTYRMTIARRHGGSVKSLLDELAAVKGVKKVSLRS
ncbi:MAG: MgtC/SapB family protein [Thermodesulfovibrionales bacterium]